VQAKEWLSVSSSGLVRLGGIVAVIAAVLLLAAEIVDAYNLAAYQTVESNREFLTTSTHAFQSALRLTAFGLLLPMGLVGLYARQSEDTGPLGVVGFVGAFAGTVLVSGFAWVDTFIAPELAGSAPQLIGMGPPPGRALSFVVFGVGWALFGLASLVGGLYPRPASALLIVGAVIGTVVALTLLPVPLGFLPFEAAVAWLGVALLTGWGGSASTQPSRVS
jgi:hypothetical protein